MSLPGAKGYRAASAAYQTAARSSGDEAAHRGEGRLRGSHLMLPSSGGAISATAGEGCCCGIVIQGLIVFQTDISLSIWDVVIEREMVG